MNIKFYHDDQRSDCSYHQIAFGGDACGVRVTSMATVSNVPNGQNVGYVFANMTVKNNLYYHNTDMFDLRVAIETEGDSEQWWNGVFSTKLRVNILKVSNLLQALLGNYLLSSYSNTTITNCPNQRMVSNTV